MKKHLLLCLLSTIGLIKIAQGVDLNAPVKNDVFKVGSLEPFGVDGYVWASQESFTIGTQLGTQDLITTGAIGAVYTYSRSIIMLTPTSASKSLKVTTVPNPCWLPTNGQTNLCQLIFTYTPTPEDESRDIPVAFSSSGQLLPNIIHVKIDPHAPSVRNGRLVIDPSYPKVLFNYPDVSYPINYILSNSQGINDVIENTVVNTDPSILGVAAFDPLATNTMNNISVRQLYLSPNNPGVANFIISQPTESVISESIEVVNVP